MKVTQSKLLNRRLRVALNEQPELSVLRARLLAIGGIEIVAPASKDLDVADLLQSGGLFCEPVVMKLGEGRHVETQRGFGSGRARNLEQSVLAMR